MNIQSEYSFIFTALTIVQLICAYLAFKSDRPIKNYTGWFNISVCIPLLSNLIIVGAHNEVLATVGYYGYYIGMTLLMITLVEFTNAYCTDVSNDGKKHTPNLMYVLAFGDIVQLLIGIFTKHIFTLNQTIVEDKILFLPVSLFGLTIHRIIDYGIFLCIILIYVLSIKKTSKLYREKYIVILAILLVSGISQGIAIAFRGTIDGAVISHGITGVVLFYFSIKYRPMRLLDTVLSSIASDMNDSVMVFDGARQCVWSNENAYKLLNVSNLPEIKPKLIELFGDMTDRGDVWTEDMYLPETQQAFTIEKKPINSTELVNGYFIIIRDSTERKKVLEQEMYQAIHDSLTDIHNQYYFYNKMRDILNNSERRYCIIFINIKNFKTVNDIFGHKFGDKCILQVAKTLKKRFGRSNTVEFARIINDNFGVFMPISQFKEETFLDMFEDFTVKSGNITQVIPIHIGVYNIKDTAIDVSVMVDRAHLALNSVTDNYKTCIRYYDDDLRNSIMEEQKLMSDLSNAIATNQIRPYLQPIVDKDNKVVGAEALARWIHPELGFLPPFKFIPLFEKNGMIADVDKHIWKCVCQILNGWKETHPDLFISINISPKDFYFIDVVQEIKDLVTKYEINPQKLRIEITETVMIDDVVNRLNDINKLRESGFVIEMDDFGSGYSSLNMLKDIPVDVLKIDMGFLDGAGETDKAQKIVYNVIAMSKDLDIKSLTEGVENLYQYESLSRMGCELFQGYYFAKPIPIEDFEMFLADHNNKK